MDEGTEDPTTATETQQLCPRETSPTKQADLIYLKVLVPSIAAGAIIGKGGEAIAQIQNETGAKIKLSKLNDFYPGNLPYDHYLLTVLR
ncbi:unnamed protein product [Dibothriocephalus latus]|uniref:K Homology domain-containing protein n=1 Tax=Dibothriocephalus latus TaxID=60516 RepID=A0A3P7NQ00_DIBLA|nr:unnamed protein product [Dibothriocephalus latus]